MKRDEKPDIDTALLGEHFNSIQVSMLEIRNFTEKKISPNPTYVYRKAVDIEHAWPSCRDLFIEMFTVLNDIACRFNIEPGSFYENDTFIEAIDAFIEELNTIMYGLADSLGTGLLSAEELDQIDDLILTVQQTAINLSKYVLSDFDYPKIRPSASS